MTTNKQPTITHKSATPMDILRFPNIRRKFFILAFDWVANAVVYNGLAYNTTNLGVSDYLAFFIGIYIFCTQISPLPEHMGLMNKDCQLLSSELNTYAYFIIVNMLQKENSRNDV